MIATNGALLKQLGIFSHHFVNTIAVTSSILSCLSPTNHSVNGQVTLQIYVAFRNKKLSFRQFSIFLVLLLFIMCQKAPVCLEIWRNHSVIISISSHWLFVLNSLGECHESSGTPISACLRWGPRGYCNCWCCNVDDAMTAPASLHQPSNGNSLTQSMAASTIFQTLVMLW